MALVVLSVLWILFLPNLSAAQATAARDFSTCDALATSQPEAEDTAKCYEETGNELSRQAEAMARIEALLRRHPGSPWLSLYLAYLDEDNAEAHYRTAARGFAGRKEARGEILARSNLQRTFFAEGRLEESGTQAELVARVAEASGDPELVARARIVQARHLRGVGKDLERAYLLLRKAESVLFPQGLYYLQRDCLIGLGNISLELGRYREGKETFRRLAALAKANGDRYAEANARYGMLRSVSDQAGEVPDATNHQEFLRLAREALDAAVTAEHRGIEAKAHLALSMLAEGPRARQHLDRCIQVAENARDMSYCLNALARRLSTEQPREANAVIDRSLEFARQAEDFMTMALAWRERMRVSWAAGPPERAIEDSQSALNAIEALRDMQALSTAQAGAFSTWSEDYYWLSGRLLQAALAGQGEEHLGEAFLVAERMRARSLIDALDAASAVPASAAPARQKRAAAMERISSVQRRLLDPDLSPGQRAEAVRELERLEMEEADLRNQLNRAAPTLAALRRPRFATIDQVRQALSPQEALLSFQIGSWEDLSGDFAGGSWLLVTTRGGTRAYRLPARGALRPAVSLFAGTFEQRDGAEAAPSVRLYEQLLGPALKELPPGIERLVIVPDDTLHRLPFGALRATAEAPPLAARFELNLVPSATVWLGWKGGRTAPAARAALALADPPTPGGRARRTGRAASAARERSAVFLTPVRLGALPYSRDESRAVVRHLGGGSVQRLGDDASEAYLKQARLHEFGVLHFATHAVTDDAHPERSGVLLAPGADVEDGLLQIREIVDLSLAGRTVVLSACSTNTGAVLRGEGVMSLARAFFQAGAHTVVASLWPLRDDEAAVFFDRFYRHLGGGASVAAALRSAQRDRIEDGAPAAAWAGIVVLGDGDAVPLPGGRKKELPLPALITAGCVLLGSLALLLVRYRKQRT
jgi:CHAT domain-containing protein/tetratricopeptide (TPR) repeat protein